MIGMRFFQGTFETRQRLFISAFSICMILPLMLKSSLKVAYLVTRNYQFYLLILSCTFIPPYGIIQFQSKKHYSNSLLISNIENIRFVVNLCLILMFSRQSFFLKLQTVQKLTTFLFIFYFCSSQFQQRNLGYYS